jgi:hypothetical protein
MRGRTLIASFFVGAGIAAVLGWPGARFDFQDSQAPGPGSDARPREPVRPEPPGNSSPTALVLEPVVHSVGPQVRGPLQSPERAVQEVAADLYRARSELFVELLVRKGLSRQDSERSVLEAFQRAAACGFETVRARAEADGKALEATYEATRAALSDFATPTQLSALCLKDGLRLAGIDLKVPSE